MFLEKTCHYCNRPAKSGYVRYDDGTICCQSCKEYYPVCSRCTKPAKQHITQDNQIVCSECVNSLHRCGICQRFILDKAYRFGEARYCVACYERAEKCSRCGAPLPADAVPAPAPGRGETTNADGTQPAPAPPRICRACYDRAAKCGFCGQPIASRAWKNESEGILACPDCYPRVEKCSRCGAPLLNAKPVKGKLYCGRCSPVQPRQSELGRREAPSAEPASGQKQHTFLVVNPTNAFLLKTEKETLLVNNCFKNYHEYVRRNVAENHGIVVSTAEEQVMCLFDAAEDAVHAAESLVRGMEGFNRQYNKLSTPMFVHVGINSIEKSVSGSVRAESLYGSVTDLASKVMELADPGMVVITEQTFEHLGKSRARFAKHRKYSDLHLSVMTYRLQ